MKRFLILLMLIASGCTKPELQEDKWYVYALTIDDPGERAMELHSLLQRHPAFEKRQTAMKKTVEAWAEASNESRAFSAARNYLDSLSGVRRISETVNIVNLFARKNIALDSALKWAYDFESKADSTGDYYGAFIRNAQAIILMKRGQIQEAYERQKLANSKYRQNDEPELVRNLALLEFKNNDIRKALAHTTPLAIDGDIEAIHYFQTWLASLNGGRDSLIINSIRTYIDSIHTDDKRMARSNSSVFMARCGFKHDSIEAWSSIPASEEKFNTEKETQFRKNRCIVLATQNRSGEALEILNSIYEMITPWDKNDILSLGPLLESFSKPREALNLYALGMLADESDAMTEAFSRSFQKEFGTSIGKRAFLESWRDSLGNFQPAHRSHQNAEKIILAELFTGADCGPCLSADLAFDDLSEFYGRNELAILEYHLHIPRPDPMTNNDSYTRYQYYGGDFGTPTVFVDGVDENTGGGPKFLKKNRFYMFNAMIEKRKTVKSSATITVNSEQKGNAIEVKAQIVSPNSKNLIVNMALVEKAIDYKGSNGVTVHRFVVRALSDSGRSLPSKIGSTMNVVKKFDLIKIAEHIQNQIDKPHEQTSWGKRKAAKPEWKNPAPKLVKDNLALVVWLQDPTTKEVVQSLYHEFPWIAKKI